MRSTSVSSDASPKAPKEDPNCDVLEGDLKSWRVQAPVVNADHLVCYWHLVPASTGLRARLIDALPTVTLPFVPDDPPQHQVYIPPGEPSPAELPPQTARDFVAVQGGYLVAYDSGEWGGGVIYYDSNGKRLQTITEERGVRLFDTADGILAFTGFAHLTADEGHVLRLSFSKNRRWSVRSAKLPGEPHAVLAEPDGSVLVATSRELIRVTEGSRIELEHKFSFGSSVISIQRDENGTLFLGMRSVVARLRKSAQGYEEDWLAPYEVKPIPPEVLRGDRPR